MPLLSGNSLRRIKSWCGEIHKVNTKLKTQERKVSDRYLAMTTKVKRNIENLVNGHPSGKTAKEELARDIRTDVEFLRSSWERENGQEGLVRKLEQFAQSTDEVKLHLQCGDYLGKNLTDIKNDLQHQGVRHPFLGGSSWECISREMACEDKVLFQYLKSQSARHYSPRPNTPTLTALEDAARRTGMDENQLRFEIDTFAARCRYAHNGIEEMIDTADFHNLATRLWADLSYINRQWAGQAPQDQGNEPRVRIRKAIERQRDRWFTYIETSADGTRVTNYALTDRAQRKVERIRARKRAAQLAQAAPVV